MKLVFIRGAGEMATGVAHRLQAVGYSLLLTELPQPLAVRRGVAFAQAVYDGSIEIEGVRARQVATLAQALDCCRRGQVPVLSQEIRGEDLAALGPLALVDARLAKVNLGTRLDEAPVVIGLGPGFTAGEDVHAVIETNRGHNMGRVLYAGTAEADTGSPGEIGGYRGERVIKVSRSGVFTSERRIGDFIGAGEIFGAIDGFPVTATIGGVIRGLLRSGTPVIARTKLGDIDPRGIRDYCFTISEKARAIGGGVLEALLRLGGGVGQ